MIKSCKVRTKKEPDLRDASILRVSMCSLAHAWVGTYHTIIDLYATDGTAPSLFSNDVYRTNGMQVLVKAIES